METNKNFEWTSAGFKRGTIKRAKYGKIKEESIDDMVNRIFDSQGIPSAESIDEMQSKEKVEPNEV